MARCEHCGAAEKIVSRCEYAKFLLQEGWPEERVNNWKASGADPPCSFDEYDELQRKIAQREFRFLLGIAAFFLGCLILIGVGIWSLTVFGTLALAALGVTMLLIARYVLVNGDDSPALKACAAGIGLAGVITIIAAVLIAFS